MTNQEIIRAWKDESYLSSLSAQQRALLPENPVGLIELDEGFDREETGYITVETNRLCSEAPLRCGSNITVCITNAITICSP
jgi:mersacidin/lichenicidin family type 2 lantibiotic